MFLFQLSKREKYISILLKLNQIFTLEFTCKDETLGDGKEGDTLTGPCEKGTEGTIKYRCKQVIGSLTSLTVWFKLSKTLKRKFR